MRCKRGKEWVTESAGRQAHAAASRLFGYPIGSMYEPVDFSVVNLTDRMRRANRRAGKSNKPNKPVMFWKAL